MKAITITVLSFLFFTGICYSQSEQPIDTAIDTSKYVTLYIYRVHVVSNRNNTFRINFADTVFKVKNNTKHTVRIYKEGPLKVWSKSETYKEVMLDTKFGEEYYIRCELRPGIFSIRPEIIIVDARFGKTEFENIPDKKP